MRSRRPVRPGSPVRVSWLLRRASSTSARLWATATATSWATRLTASRSAGAGSVLLRELIVLVYALVVAGPLLLLGALALTAARLWRRRATERLLAR